MAIQDLSSRHLTFSTEEPPLETVENSEVLTYLKALFPSLSWTHYPYVYQGNEKFAGILGQARLNYGILVGQGKFFHIRVEILPIGVKADLSFGRESFGMFTTQCLLATSNKVKGCSLNEALNPIRQVWVGMQSELND